MSDLIRRSDALKALDWKWAGKAAIDAVKAIPAVDAVEVVHYRECEFWAYDAVTVNNTAFCYRLCRLSEEYFFCKDGQRREDGDGDG